MRYSAVSSILLAAATAAPALALPTGLLPRAAEGVYERDLEDSFWARDVMPRGGGWLHRGPHRVGPKHTLPPGSPKPILRLPPVPHHPPGSPKPILRPLPPPHHGPPFPPVHRPSEVRELLAREFEEELFARAIYNDELD
ncbi:uncharacterized protein B0H18DRAFT_953255 [Fomitopsis serialis]|uniref:uncharacterized protein n=1 Tax=Fomitopsis serialis TaxID=139415 RepID=UPI00200889DC|nr:uncharacterized protein B0H18DRAFT_953255 [Neoantrodia serialis]KAH9930358.1 hypothetical protein B0H18DRAFT_953255 [Neoantrodia serialis]